MSRSAQTVASPVRHSDGHRTVGLRELQAESAFGLAAADDLATGIQRVVGLIRRTSGAARVEWWTAVDGDSPELVAATGVRRGLRREVTLGDADVVAVFGDRVDGVDSVLAQLQPIVRRRRAEERLTDATIDLVRRNEALEDFAALVAHELKTPLLAARAADDASRFVEHALNVVDTLLEAARSDTAGVHVASVAECLERAVQDLGAAHVEISADLDTTLPLPPESLRLILRNLVSNADAAGARHIHVTAARSLRSCRLFVDDDGIGLEGDGYRSGSGLGFGLCRRVAERFGGVLELSPRPDGGTRATLALAEAPG